MHMKKVLTIAGFDPSGGAGVTRDILTISSLGCSPIALITSMTVQNSRKVSLAKTVDTKVFLRQAEKLLEESVPDSVKIGMLGGSKMVGAVVDVIRRFELKNIVLDPVLESTSGYPLLDDRGIKVLKDKLLPWVRIITPNIPEANRLSGLKIGNVKDMIRAAGKIYSFGAETVLIKGGHLAGDPVDVFTYGVAVRKFRTERVKSSWSHGTGCVLSSAIASCLANNGGYYEEAVEGGLDYIKRSLAYRKEEGLGLDRYTSERLKLIEKMKGAISILKNCNIYKLIPEVGSNIAECIDGARDHLDVLGLSGRILKDATRAVFNCSPDFGASRHVATIALTANHFDRDFKSAMNLKFSDETVRLCRRLGFKVGEFKRTSLPERKSTMESGTMKVIKKLSLVPDVIFDRGGMGKEAMLRVLGKDSLDVAEKVKKICGGLK